MQEGHRGDGLKEAGRSRQKTFGDEPLRCVYDGFEVPAEVIVGDKGVFHADLRDLMGDLRRTRENPDSLVDAHQVRRGVEAGAQAGGGEDAGESGGGGAFAIGAGDEHGAKALLGIAERSHEGAHLGQLELAPGLAGGGVQLRAQGLQAVDCLGVEHVFQFTRIC